MVEEVKDIKDIVGIRNKARIKAQCSVKFTCTTW